MKTYCLECGSEREMLIEKVTTNNRRHQEKLEGWCESCGEYLCHILAVEEDKTKEED